MPRPPVPRAIGLACVLACLGAAAPAGSSAAGLPGARFSFSASAGAARASGSGRVASDAPSGGEARVRLRLPGRGGRVDVAVRTWKLVTHGRVATLALRIRVVRSTAAAACPVAARGTVTLTDDPVAGDAVAVEFARGRCGGLTRAWRRPVGGTKAKVSIRILYASR